MSVSKINRRLRNRRLRQRLLLEHEAPQQQRLLRVRRRRRVLDALLLAQDADLTATVGPVFVELRKVGEARAVVLVTAQTGAGGQVSLAVVQGIRGFGWVVALARGLYLPIPIGRRFPLAIHVRRHGVADVIHLRREICALI